MLTILMVLVIVFSNAAGDVFLTKGMKQIGDISVLRPFQVLQTIRQILSNPNFLAGIACLTLSFFSFLSVLSWADLSFVIPATAIYYVVTVLGAKFLLGERIDLMRWAGTLLVCLGVALVCLPEDKSLSVPAILEVVRIILFVLAAASAVYYLISIIASERFFSAPPAHHPGEFRPISILIPLRGADFDAYKNYAALCRQDYPEFEIVFGVGDSRDSSIPVIARLRADFPQVPIKLVISAATIGPNPKVNTLNNMLPQTRYETLILLDSDIRVGPDFVKTIAAELPANDQGLVTCLYRAAEAPGIPAKLEAAGISSEFAPGVLVAEMGGGISFAFGAAIALSRKTLDTIGGFETIAPYLADDYMLGNLVRKAGLPVKLSRYVVETVLPRMRLDEFVRHQVRWARGIRACAPLGHTGSLIQNGTLLSFLYFVFSGFSGFGLSIFATVAALRLAMAWMVGVRRLGDKILRHNLLLALARDVFSFFIWMAAQTGKRVVWRGLVFQLEDDGKITPLKTPRFDSQIYG
jgi:ceramide glucosyltransferase